MCLLLPLSVVIVVIIITAFFTATVTLGKQVLYPYSMTRLLLLQVLSYI
jgi:hypothetical protein